MRSRKAGSWISSRRRRVGVAVVCGAIGILSVVLASCSLDLDESLIDRVADGGPSDDVAVEPVDQRAPDADAAQPRPDAGGCTSDEECEAGVGCLTASCDVSRRSCVYRVCRSVACSSSTCSLDNGACDAGKSYTYGAAQFPVGTAIGCGGALGRCFAAVYPFVFVGTTNGVIAYSASDPQSASPAQVPVVGLGFVPAQIIASGSRVYFISTPGGVGSTSVVSLAWADVPTDPFASSIRATTVLATIDRPATEALVLLPRAGDTALLMVASGSPNYPSATLEPPLAEPVVITTTALSLPTGAAPAATSGTRLIASQYTAAGVPVFNFVEAAGSPVPMTMPDVMLAPSAPASSPQAFAQTAQGLVFWAYASLSSSPSGPPPPAVRAVRGSFLVADGSASFDQTVGVDIDLFPGGPPPSSLTVGPVAIVDANTAMVTTAVPGSPNGASRVSFVRREPAGLVKNADDTVRRLDIPQPVTQLAAAGSNGIGYVLVVNPAMPNAPAVHVFDPGCAP